MLLIFILLGLGPLSSIYIEVLSLGHASQALALAFFKSLALFLYITP